MVLNIKYFVLVLVIPVLTKGSWNLNFLTFDHKVVWLSALSETNNVGKRRRFLIAFLAILVF